MTEGNKKVLLPGEAEIIEELKIDSLELHQFYEIEKINIDKVYDDILWRDVYNGFIVISDGSVYIKIEMKNIHEKFSVCLPSRIDLFAIGDYSSNGYENDNRYHLTDLEDIGGYSIDIWCEDLFLSLEK